MAGLPRLDRIDINILAQLQLNGRLSNVDLADAVGLSSSPCLARVRRLQDSGYITSYNAKLNLAKLLECITVFTEITLHDHRREDFIKFETEIRRYENIQEVHLISGGHDYLLKILIKSVSAYQRLMESILDRNIGVDKYFSYIVIKTVIERNVPLKALMDN